MAIVKLQKATLVCRSQDKDAVLGCLQEFGKLHLNSLSGSAEASAETSIENNDKKDKTIFLSDDLKKALRYLSECPVKRKQVAWDEEFDVEELIRKVLVNQENRRRRSDEYEKLVEREDNLKHWGEFSFPALEEMAGQRLWFYILPDKHLRTLDALKVPWQIIHREHHKNWLVLVCPEEPATDLLPVERVRTGALPLSEVSMLRHKLDLELEDLEFERQRFTRYIHVLKRLTARIEDQSNFGKALEMSLDDEPLSMLQCWIARRDVDALKELARRQGFAVYLEEVSLEDEPPTLLSNPPGLRGGEALVNFYQTPAYSAWDPSLILFGSFSLFFAMIMSDAAYSMILLALLAAGWRTLGKSSTGRNLRPLLLALTSVSLVWGVLVGSYFGRSPPVTWLEIFHVLDVNDFPTMMAISIACGIIHILLANLQQVILWWGHGKSVMHIGWILVLLAGAVLGLELPAVAAYVTGATGLLLVFIGGGQRKIKTVTDMLVRVLEGLKALSNITNIFGDVLSYLRLFALGLASASLALTFNDLADGAFASESGLGILFGVLILLVGHTLNLLLGIVSGVVHGLRLNFIEFYKWALDGEGKPFKAFKKQEYSR